MSVKKVNLSYLLHQMELDDLEFDENGIPNLLTSIQIEQVKKSLHNKKNGFYRKKDEELRNIKIPYNIFKEEGKYYAIYRGVKHGAALGAGNYGTVKLA